MNANNGMASKNTMRAIKVGLAGVAMLVAAGMAAQTATAGITQYGDRSAFITQGTIIENYGFEDFGTDFSSPGNPWTTHGVTYQTGDNLIVGTNTDYGPISNVFAYNYWTPILATISDSPNQFDMFGVDLGYIGFNSQITFEVQTNLATYTFSGITAPAASQSLDFNGFIADTGEHFTGFRLASVGGSGSAPVIDNVTLGQTGQITVPEPTSIALLGLGMAGLAFTRRRKTVC